MKKLKGKYIHEELLEMQRLTNEIIAMLDNYETQTPQGNRRMNELTHQRDSILFIKDGGYREILEERRVPRSENIVYLTLGRFGKDKQS